jgi:tRNA pseudouridine55 synthase
MNILTKSNLNNFSNWFDEMQNSGGLLLVNKPLGYTSFAIINSLKRIFKGKKIGHSGTLDPLASGLMIIAIGKATKLLNDLILNTKVYSGLIKIGVETSSLDKETPEVNHTQIPENIEDKILKTLPYFTGDMEQVPPLHSALKVDGKRAYKLARKNIEKSIAPRKVTILDYNILDIDIPYIKFRINVTSGFYVRTFAQDFGKFLGLPAYLYKLNREQIGEFSIEESVSVEEIQKQLSYLQTEN